MEKTELRKNLAKVGNLGAQQGIATLAIELGKRMEKRGDGFLSFLDLVEVCEKVKKQFET